MTLYGGHRRKKSAFPNIVRYFLTEDIRFLRVAGESAMSPQAINV